MRSLKGLKKFLAASFIFQLLFINSFSGFAQVPGLPNIGNIVPDNPIPDAVPSPNIGENIPNVGDLAGCGGQAIENTTNDGIVNDLINNAARTAAAETDTERLRLPLDRPVIDIPSSQQQIQNPRTNRGIGDVNGVQHVYDVPVVTDPNDPDQQRAAGIAGDLRRDSGTYKNREVFRSNTPVGEAYDLYQNSQNRAANDVNGNNSTPPLFGSSGSSDLYSNPNSGNYDIYGGDARFGCGGDTGTNIYGGGNSQTGAANGSWAPSNTQPLPTSGRSNTDLFGGGGSSACGGDIGSGSGWTSNTDTTSGGTGWTSTDNTASGNSGTGWSSSDGVSAHGSGQYTTTQPGSLSGAGSSAGGGGLYGGNAPIAEITYGSGNCGLNCVSSGNLIPKVLGGGIGSLYGGGNLRDTLANLAGTAAGLGIAELTGSAIAASAAGSGLATAISGGSGGDIIDAALGGAGLAALNELGGGLHNTVGGLYDLGGNLGGHLPVGPNVQSTVQNIPGASDLNVSLGNVNTGNGGSVGNIVNDVGNVAGVGNNVLSNLPGSYGEIPSSNPLAQAVGDYGFPGSISPGFAGGGIPFR